MSVGEKRSGPGLIRLAAMAVALPMVMAGGGHAQEPAAASAAMTAQAPVTLPPLSAAQAALVFKVLGDAPLHGLSATAYAPADVAGEPTPEQHKALADGLVRYAHDLRVGRLLPGDFPAMWGLRPAPFDPTPELAQAIATDRLGPFLDSLAPAYSGYSALRRGLARYRAIADDGGWKPVPEGAAFGLGATGPRVAALRARLAAEDKDVPADGATFDTALQQGVIRAQRRFGLKPDGVVAGETLAALNQPVGQRVLQVIANMERWRWMPRTMPATRVQVNSGAAIVTLFRNDKPVLSMKAVSGRAGGDETPMLASEIHSVVLNPPWNVPTSIANEELWPKERKNPGYLTRSGYVVIPTEGGGKRLQQKAGPTSALGRYKFDFENPYSVYLHDTPSKGGFDRYARQASHGCVRLEKPQALAEALLAADPAWSKEAIAGKVAAGTTVRAQLPDRIPVYILYWTTFAGADGQMHFRSDPYGWDRGLLQRVGVLAGSKSKGSEA